MGRRFQRRTILGAGAAGLVTALAGCSDSSDGGDGTPTDSPTNTSTETATESKTDPDSETMPSTILNGDVEQQGELSLSSPDFDDGERMPDWTGYANENENPELEISGVPDGAESLVLIVDDPDAQPVAGHTWDHWYAWDIDPDIGTIPRDWGGGDATEGFNDFTEFGYGGPSPPEGSHGYRFKLVAVDAELGVPEATRKTRVGSAIAMNAEVLGATQIVGTYSASQGTAF
jgi:hypothetical protein